MFNTHQQHGDIDASNRLRSALEDRCDVRVVTERDGVARMWQEAKERDLGLQQFADRASLNFTAAPWHTLSP